MPFFNHPIIQRAIHVIGFGRMPLGGMPIHMRPHASPVEFNRGPIVAAPPIPMAQLPFVPILPPSPVAQAPCGCFIAPPVLCTPTPSPNIMRHGSPLPIWAYSDSHQSSPRVSPVSPMRSLTPPTLITPSSEAQSWQIRAAKAGPVRPESPKYGISPSAAMPLYTNVFLPIAPGARKANQMDPPPLVKPVPRRPVGHAIGAVVPSAGRLDPAACGLEPPTDAAWTTGLESFTRDDIGLPEQTVQSEQERTYKDLTEEQKQQLHSGFKPIPLREVNPSDGLLPRASFVTPRVMHHSSESQPAALAAVVPNDDGTQFDSGSESSSCVQSPVSRGYTSAGVAERAPTPYPDPIGGQSQIAATTNDGIQYGQDYSGVSAATRTIISSQYVPATTEPQSPTASAVASSNAQAETPAVVYYHRHIMTDEDAGLSLRSARTL